MKSPLLKKVAYGLLVSGIMLFAFWIRTYKLAENTVFFDDQGMDLSVIWNMEHKNHRPLIGPFLTVEKIYTPPTYYYVSWIFYHLNPTPEGVTVGHLILNLTALLLFIMLISDIAGKKAGLFGGLLYATSYTMVFHGRTFWQPFSMQPFLVLQLLFLWHAYRKKSLLLLFISHICFSVALSIYPSPFILLPFTLYHSIRWFTHNKFHRYKSVFFGIGALTVATIPIFIPQIIFESSNGFPTVKTIFTQPLGTVFRMQPLLFIINHAMSIVDNLIKLLDLLPAPWAHITTLAFIAGIFVLGRYTRRNMIMTKPFMMRLTDFIPPWAIICGLPILVIVHEIAQHRLWALLPIQFFVLTMVLYRSFYSTRRIQTIAALLLTIYLLLNGLSIYKFSFHLITDSTYVNQSIATIIIRDMEQKNHNQTDVGITYTIQNQNFHYRMYRILYWLIASQKFQFSLTTNGNDVDYSELSSIEKPKKTIYLICRFESQAKAMEACVMPFINTAKTFTVSEIYPANAHLFLYILDDIRGNTDT